MKEIKLGLQQTGTSFTCSFMPFLSNLFAVGIERTLNAMKDDRLGAFELHSSIN